MVAPARPWYARSENGFKQLATFFQEFSGQSQRDLFEFCRSEMVESARTQVLSTPSAAFAISAALTRIADEFAETKCYGLQSERQPGAANFEIVFGRIEFLAKLIAIVARGGGPLDVLEVPCSLPGLGVCVVYGLTTLKLHRKKNVWEAEETGGVRTVEQFQLYDSPVLVDAGALWITGSEFADGTCQPGAWSGEDVPARAAGLIEKSLGSAGQELAQLIHTIVPLKEVKASSFASSTNRLAPGALYVTASSRPEMLAEMIVHEAGHAWLNLHQTHGAVISDNARLMSMPSPFTGTDRPVRGILHGVIAFSWITQFWRGLLRIHPDLYASVAERRLCATERQVREAVRSLEILDAITPWGWELVHKASQAVKT